MQIGLIYNFGPATYGRSEYWKHPSPLMKFFHCRKGPSAVQHQFYLCRYLKQPNFQLHRADYYKYLCVNSTINLLTCTPPYLGACPACRQVLWLHWKMLNGPEQTSPSRNILQETLKVSNSLTVVVLGELGCFKTHWTFHTGQVWFKKLLTIS